MMNYIGCDVHVSTTVLAVERKGKIIQRYQVPTKIPSLREVLETIKGKKTLIIEEGCMSGWLYRNLKQNVDKMIVCDPRRNHYIAKDGDKDDKIDAAKLAELARGGFLREVYHSSDQDMVIFKQWVGIYHDRVRERTRQINKIRALARCHGVLMPSCVFEADSWSQWLEVLEDKVLQHQLRLLYMGYDSVSKQVKLALKEVRKQRKKYPIISYWEQLPGIGEIRSSTLFTYLDTPWRFSKPSKLWKYCGLGLQRSASGTDRQGKPKRGKLQLAWQVNRRLKDAIMGAVINAICGDNCFAVEYRRLLKDGLTPSNARHTVGRKMLSVIWGMWKRNERFNAKLL